jgi:chaperone required for assembly of F1-ATPase
MRDILSDLDTNRPDNPMEAARRAMRPPLRRRFYQDAGVQRTDDGFFAVTLDGKPMRTPGRRLLALPTQMLAEQVAGEWAAQGETIDPAAMPLTRLCNSIIDAVSEACDPVAEDILKYLASDLLLYRAEGPEALTGREAQHWDPVLAWAGEALGLRFILVAGTAFAAQPETTLRAAREALPADAWQLGAMHVVTTLTGSALIALALMHDALSIEAAWVAAHVDEDWNMDIWGRDEMALARRQDRYAEMAAAVAVLRSIR